MAKYQWELNIRQTNPAKKLGDFRTQFGWEVLHRYASGEAKQSRLSIYTKTIKPDLYLACQANDWGKSVDDKFKFTNHHNGFYTINVDNKEVLAHGESYMILVDDMLLHDPATEYFDENGKSIFWDFGDKQRYQPQHSQPNRTDCAIKILQTDLPGLVNKFADKSGTLGADVPLDQTYKFIAESGVIAKIAELGFNTVQFLPISQSIDGDKWSFRYLTPFIHSINNRWGNPDDVRRMIDEFHKHGIAVICDFVISHIPVHNYLICGQSQAEIGIHHWIGDHREEIWLGEETSWGTRRYNYDNHSVQDFITEAAIKMLKYYNIDGFRIDNVDGIMRHGDNGDGHARAGGRETLRKLHKTIYEYDPHAYIHLESHYFHGGEAKLLTLPIKANRQALGATAYTSSRLTHFLHKDYMPKAAAQITPWKIREIISEKEWGQSNSTVADFHNHDAAAGLMHGRATGSYAYDALILGNPALHEHAVGKIKVMEAIISFGMEGRTLDLLQSHLLQTGTFEHDSTIHWYLEMVEASSAVLNFKTQVNKLLDEPAFWFKHTDNRQYSNIDEDAKSLVIHRTDKQDSSYMIYINMAGHMLFDYVIPVSDQGQYELVLNSDSLKYAGSGRVHIPQQLESNPVDLFEFFSNGIKIASIAPYQVLVLRKLTPSKF